MATIHGDRMLSPVVVTVSAVSIDVHADAPIVMANDMTKQP